ncbi:hypothetical protein DY000_02000945 [Brassica cretica]|uniref:Reverse transcriptase zinc-binding domain-containing protein n=1 Tax=Brassica cretica TaxID=69181 RepID=A0ABQ7BXT4_BRACR|nr:hypothetical protein DY000_02000945 [Brassica cretica]
MFLKPSLGRFRRLLRIKTFIWKALSQALPVAVCLIERACHVARICWALSNIPCPRLGFSVSSIYENISYLLSLRPVGSAHTNLKIVIIDTSQTTTGPDIGEPIRVEGPH